MKTYLHILFIFLFFVNFSCSRDSKTEPINKINQAVNQKADFQQKNIQDTSEIESNQAINDSIIRDETKTQNENKASKVQHVKSNPYSNPESSNSGFNWWINVSLVLFLINLILILSLYQVNKYKNRYKKQRDDLKKEKEYYERIYNLNNSKLEKIEKDKNLSSNTNQKNIKKVSDTTDSRTQNQINSQEDEIQKAVELQVDNGTSHPQQITNKPITLYAEKASENGTFSNVSEQKDIHKSIFKLILIDEKSINAEFEVLDTDFILKLAANSPDTYLYSVCKPENSNQNFSDEIITIKKGVAHKVDGKWIVKNDNKATIKFQ